MSAQKKAEANAGKDEETRWILVAGMRVPDYCCLWNRTSEGDFLEKALEAGADALLRIAPPAAASPTYTEAQLERHGEGKRLPLDETLLECVEATQSLEDFLDDLRFLASLSPLSVAERIVLFAALEGDTQDEIAARMVPALSQQRVSRLLRSALRKLYEKWGLSFWQFSRHAIYRRPAKRKHTGRGLFCLRCGDWFPFGLGAGPYCSERCRGNGRH